MKKCPYTSDTSPLIPRKGIKGVKLLFLPEIREQNIQTQPEMAALCHPLIDLTRPVVPCRIPWNCTSTDLLARWEIYGFYGLESDYEDDGGNLFAS